MALKSLEMRSTRWPFWANKRAVAAPIPLEAPVKKMRWDFTGERYEVNRLPSIDGGTARLEADDPVVAGIVPIIGDDLVAIVRGCMRAFDGGSPRSASR